MCPLLTVARIFMGPLLTVAYFFTGFTSGGSHLQL
jgi:hypothetical protein